MLLMPGFIDAHTHFDLDVSNTTTADNFTTGSRAACGVAPTTVVDFACPNEGSSTTGWSCGTGRLTAAPAATTASHDHRRLNPQIEAEIDDMYAAGISSFQDVHDPIPP